MSDEFKSWEEMSVLEQYACQYWDMHKDAYGFRPRGIDTSSWTVEQFEEEFESLQKAINANYEQEKEQQALAMVAFEARIAEVIASGARNRDTAMRWIHEAEGSQGDDEYLCFLAGLPYGYFRKVA
jgi:hypothetical protein